MERVKPFALLSGIIVVGIAVEITQRYSTTSAWLMVIIVLLGATFATPEAPQRFATSLDSLRSLMFG